MNVTHITLPGRAEGYAHAGTLNGMTTAEQKGLHDRWQGCIDAGHATRTQHTERGQHKSCCDVCKYVWGYDSSG